MKFSESEINFLISDIETLLDEFNQMSQEEYISAEPMKNDVSFILERLKKYNDLDDEHKNILHLHVYKLYDFIEDSREEHEEEVLNELEGMNMALESTMTNAEEGDNEEFSAMHELSKEMGAIAKVLTGDQKLSETELRAIEKSLDDLAKKFNDTYGTN